MSRTSLLERPEAVALLEDAEVSAAAVRGCQNRLEHFLRRYLPCFYREEQRDWAETVRTPRRCASKPAPPRRRRAWPASQG